MPSKSNRRTRGETAPAQPAPGAADSPVGAPPPDIPPQTAGKPARAGPLVAGLGASAGGLGAFRRFLAATPPDSGVAFVLVPHLDPGHESLLADLLARHSPVPVVEAADNTPVEPDRVYVIPPNKYMTIRGGVLRLAGPVEPHTSQTCIDHFLRSLADDQKERAVCVILTGTGSHGTLGLQAVKAAGGMVMVQDPATAECEQMPRAAVATGLADFVLPVEQLPGALVRHASANSGRRDDAPPEAVDHLAQVIALMQVRARFDFRGYRRRMLARRVERRMGLNHIADLRDYVTYLRGHPEETDELVKDLFIRGTGFFRDPEAFQQLAEQAIAPLVAAADTDGVIRVWVPGCSTGEEPYSLAMLLLEQLAAAHKHCRVQIFATDVDDAALAVARRGVYAGAISAAVSPERLARFFTKVDNYKYHVNEPLRDAVTFAVQNVVRDPPFARLDLLCCRNLLTDLETAVQRRVLAQFHFALRPGGFLFLGPSESADRPGQQFEPVSKPWRIYRRVGPPRPERAASPVAAASAPDHRPAGARPPNYAEVAHRLLLERYAPAAVLVDRKFEVLYYFGPCTRYLEFPPGRPTHDLTQLAREGLRTTLRGAAHRALAEHERVVLPDVRVTGNGASVLARVTVSPVHAAEGAEGLLLITFEDVPAAPAPVSAAGAGAALQHVEGELRAARDDLQRTVEELESSNEELVASNEETRSVNEELRSTNAALATSRAELQTLNEELTTVNTQLHEKIDQLAVTTNDLANLLQSTDVATVFLDAGQRIKLFTPSARRVFHLVAADVGRPLRDITPRFTDPDLLRDAREVPRELAPREAEVQGEDGRWYARRVLAYRTRDHRIDGTVITFVDVTERKRAADATDRRLAAIVESSADAIFSKDLDGTVRTWNHGAERLYGYPAGELVGRSIRAAVPADRVEEWERAMARVGRGEAVEQMETERLRKDGRRVPVVVTYSPIRDAGGRVASVSAIVRDLSERHRAEQALRDREQRLQAILDAAADAVVTIDHRGRIQSVNRATERLFGYTAAELIGQNVALLTPLPYRDAPDGYLARYLRERQKSVGGISRETEARRKDGSVFPTELTVCEIAHLNLFTCIHRDLTERKQLERAVVEAASLEQRRIGQDLHDTVAQELTALNLLAGDLAETLRADPAKAAALVEQVARGLQRSQRQLRAVLRGLLPVAVDSAGLMAALADLADRTRQEGKVACEFDCPAAVSVADNLTATHLYLIAQEAVYNAVKHAQARTVRIALRSDGGLTLRVQDDGRGMPAAAGNADGLGLRIMHSRASIIGARLAIEPAAPTGTVIICALTGTAHEREEAAGAHARPDRR